MTKPVDLDKWDYIHSPMKDTVAAIRELRELRARTNTYDTGKILQAAARRTKVTRRELEDELAHLRAWRRVECDADAVRVMQAQLVERGALRKVLEAARKPRYDPHSSLGTWKCRICDGFWADPDTPKHARDCPLTELEALEAAK